MTLVDLKTVVLHPELFLCPPPLEKWMSKLLRDEGINALDYSRVNTPFIFQDKQTHLLSHHLVYLLAKHSGIQSIYMRHALTPDQIRDVLAVDSLSYAVLEFARLNSKNSSAQTRSHQKRRTAKQMCPLCPGFLTAQKDKHGKIREGKEFFEIKCHYRHYKGYNCEFHFELEKEDYRLFKQGRFPTNKWLQRLDTERCPLCNDSLFERKSSDGKVFHQCRKTLTKQFPGDDFCDYNIEISRDKLKRRSSN